MERRKIPSPQIFELQLVMERIFNRIETQYQFDEFAIAPVEHLQANGLGLIGVLNEKEKKDLGGQLSAYFLVGGGFLWSGPGGNPLCDACKASLRLLLWFWGVSVDDDLSVLLDIIILGGLADFFGASARKIRRELESMISEASTVLTDVIEELCVILGPCR